MSLLDRVFGCPKLLSPCWPGPQRRKLLSQGIGNINRLWVLSLYLSDDVSVPTIHDSISDGLFVRLDLHQSLVTLLKTEKRKKG